LIADECWWSAARAAVEEAAESARSLRALELSERSYGADVPADLKAEFEGFYDKNLPADRLVLDVLEEDDARSFPPG
jgi:hypothetical protein